MIPRNTDIIMVIRSFFTENGFNRLEKPSVPFCLAEQEDEASEQSAEKKNILVICVADF